MPGFKAAHAWADRGLEDFGRRFVVTPQLNSEYIQRCFCAGGTEQVAIKSLGAYPAPPRAEFMF